MKNLKILIVDDNPADRLLFKEAVSEFNIKFETCSEVVQREGAEEMFSYLKECQTSQSCPDIIVLDINMPRMNGIKALEKLKKKKEFRKTPVLMLTTSGNSEEVLKCWDAGCHSFVKKPLEFREFSNKIGHHLETWANIICLPTKH